MSAKKRQVGGDHYSKMAVQPAEFMHKNGIGYLEGLIIKYAARHKDKGGAEDLRKVIHTAELLLELEYGEKP